MKSAAVSEAKASLKRTRPVKVTSPEVASGSTAATKEKPGAKRRPTLPLSPSLLDNKEPLLQGQATRGEGESDAAAWQQAGSQAAASKSRGRAKLVAPASTGAAHESSQADLMKSQQTTCPSKEEKGAVGRRRKKSPAPATSAGNAQGSSHVGVVRPSTKRRGRLPPIPILLNSSELVHDMASVGATKSEQGGSVHTQKNQTGATAPGQLKSAAKKKVKGRGRHVPVPSPPTQNDCQEQVSLELAQGLAGVELGAPRAPTPTPESTQRGFSSSQELPSSMPLEASLPSSLPVDDSQDLDESLAAEQASDQEQAMQGVPEALKRKKKQSARPPVGPAYVESMRPAPLAHAAMRLMSWNVAGIRSLLRKDPQALSKLVAREQPDIICLQEIKISEKHVANIEAQLDLPGWHAVWNCCVRKAGYSGTATISRAKPLSWRMGIGIPELDDEGRVLATEHPEFWLVNVYVPNSSENLRRLDYRIVSWDIALSEFCKELESSGKPVILTGDMNCCHKEIDIHAPKANKWSAGFTNEERESFQACYMDRGFVDTWRNQFPGIVGYTYYTRKLKTAREENKGWRLDYFMVSEQLVPRCYDSFMLKDVVGSDHIPIGLVISQPGHCRPELAALPTSGDPQAATQQVEA